MPESLPDVLVVVPTLGKRLDTLMESLNSVTSQEGANARVVVVIPEVSVEARATAERMGATVIDDPGDGLSAAVNAGFAARQDETYYAWLNDDDFFAPGALRLLVSMLDANPEASVAFGACVYIDDQGRKIGVSRAGDTASRILGWGPDLVPQPAALHRVDAVVAAGEYDENLRFAMDLDMLLRLRRIGPFVSTKEIISSFRWHAESLTVANRKHSLAESEAVKHRYLSPRARRIAPLWDIPVRLATHVAAGQVNRRARKLAATEVQT